MWKVFFPGGDPLVAPLALQEFDQKYQVSKMYYEGIGRMPSAEENKIRLLSRVFCMFSLEDAGVELQSADGVQLPCIDFDLAQFCTLLERFKFTWRTTLQVILFRAFLSGRSGLANIQKVLKKLCFQKKASSGLTGLIFKVFLTRVGLDEFFKAFSFLTREQIAQVVHYGCQHWVMLKKIHEGVSQSAQAEGQSQEVPYLKQQFDEAHDFLVLKVSAHNKASNNLFSNALEVLEKIGGGAAAAELKAADS